MLLVNAQHVKNVPGRKTDVKDAEWLAQLLHCFMLTQHLAIIDALVEQIEIFNQEIKAQLELATSVAVTPKPPQLSLISQ